MSRNTIGLLAGLTVAMVICVNCGGRVDGVELSQTDSGAGMGTGDPGIDSGKADTGTESSIDAGAVDSATNTKTDASSPQYGVLGQSCAGGLDCNGVDCCQSILVPGGAFSMGRSVSGTDAFSTGYFDEQPEHNATVDSFYLDTLEVTVGRFRKFVAAYNGTPPPVGSGDHHGLGVGWQGAWNSSLPASQAELIKDLKSLAVNPLPTWTDAPGGNEKYAICNVTWFEATAFCLWDGARLPTEAEWEYAAAGGSENRLYPWGSAAPDPAFANYFKGNSWENNSANTPLLDVGSFPKGAGKWGHEDLGGGMLEWTMDWYNETYYSGIGGSCNNCVNSNNAESRVIRGGSWNNMVDRLRAASRNPYYPVASNNNLGFRCARTP